MNDAQLSSANAFPIILRSADEVTQLIEAEAARRAETESWRWRFRLICLETIMFASLVAAAGIALDQPRMLVMRVTVLVAISCFITGLILLALSAWTGRLLTRFRLWRAR